MKLTNDFTVPAAVDRAYAVLLDVERVAPCLPGAALEGGDGETFDGAMTIKLGPVISRFEGTVRIVESDEVAHRAVLRAEAKDARGNGTAAATITTAMREVSEGTRVSVETELQVSGPAAQFSRGVMQDVSGKLMRQFAGCLAEEMQEGGFVAGGAPAGDDLQLVGSGGAPPAGVTSLLEYEETAVGRLPKGPAADAALAAAAERNGAAQPAPARRAADVLDLGAASRDAVLRRVVPVAAAVAGAAIAFILWRRNNK
jgi:uncharacterized protein